MPAYDGSRITVDLTLTVLGIAIIVTGTIELLAIRKEVA